MIVKFVMVNIHVVTNVGLVYYYKPTVRRLEQCFIQIVRNREGFKYFKYSKVYISTTVKH